MTDKIEIKKEMILAACDYIPVAEKEAWVGERADKCFDRLAITANGEQMPPMYSVNVSLRNRYLMAAFAKRYLKQEIETEDGTPDLMTETEYDRWAGSHVFGQIDRLKRDAEVRDKCYDLMADYKELSKWLATQINSMLTVQNDPVVRQAEFGLAQVEEALPELLMQFQQFQKLQEGRANGE